MSARETSDNFTPENTILLNECPRLRILVLGKSGVGKSHLINTVFGIERTPVATDKPGVHDVHSELTSPSNNRIIIHDSQGFEAGEDRNYATVVDFVNCRSKAAAMKDRLHAIWLCAEIPFAGARTFEFGVEQFLAQGLGGDVPVFVIFTKLDLLYEHCERQLEDDLEQKGQDMSDQEFETMIEQIVATEVDRLCVKPLRMLRQSSNSEPFQWIATSVRPRHASTIENLLKVILEASVQLETTWLNWAIAQRVSATHSIEASVRIGKKRYWRGLCSDIFIGVTMKKCIDVLRKDIVAAWNLEDSQGHLNTTEFLALMSALVHDLVGDNKNQYPLTMKATEALITNPTLIVVTGPTLVVVFFAEWVTQTYKKTKISLRCMAGFIVDLTLTMDTLFWLTRARLGYPITIKLINRALQIYKVRKPKVHDSIRAWVNDLGSFEFLNPDIVIEKVKEIIEQHRFRPEERERIGEELADEAWMASEELMSC